MSKRGRNITSGPPKRGDTMKSVNKGVEKQVREMVSKADVNKDGNLSREELEKIVQDIKEQWPHADDWMITHRCDTDKDGKISPSEMNRLVNCLIQWYNMIDTP